jgi:hypothetical protein
MEGQRGTNRQDVGGGAGTVGYDERGHLLRG